MTAPRNQGLSPAGRSLLEPASLFLLLVFTALTACYPVSGNDVGFHLSCGEEILATGGIPERNFLSWANADHAWTNDKWLFQVVVACCYRFGGWSGLILFRALCASLTAFLLWRALPRPRSSLSAPASAAVLAIAMVPISFRMEVRPEMISFVLLALVACLLARARRRTDRPTSLAWLPVVQVVWINVHGYAWLGPLVVACFCLEAAIEAFLARGEARARARARKWFANLVLILILSSLATLLHVQGFEQALYPVLFAGELQGSGRILRFTVNEYRPLRWFMLGDPTTRVTILALHALLVLSALMLVLRRWRGNLPELVLVCLFALACTRLSRWLGPFALFAGLWCGARLASGRPLHLESRIPLWARRAWAGAVLVGLALCCVLVPFDLFHKVDKRAKLFGLGLEAVRTPEIAARWLAAHPLPCRYFNSYDAGSHLAFRLRPDALPLIDTNTAGYPPRFYRDTASALASADPERISEEFGTQAFVLVVQQNTFDLIGNLERDPGWLRAHVDPRHVIYVRRGLLDLAEASLDPDRILGAIPSDLARDHEAEMFALAQLYLILGRHHELARLVALGLHRFPESMMLQQAKAELLERRGRLEEAVATLRNVLRDYPRSSACRRQLARILVQMGRESDARTVLLGIRTWLPTAGWRACAQKLIYLEIESGRLGVAERLVEELIEDNPEDPLLLHEAGQIFDAMNRPAAALHSYLRCLELDPDAAEGYLHVGRRALRLGRVQLGRSLFEKGLQVAPPRRLKALLEAELERLRDLGRPGLPAEGPSEKR